MYISSFIGKFFPSYPFNCTNISFLIAEDASEKKNAFNFSSSISFFETVLDCFP